MQRFLTGKLNKNYGISPSNYIDIVGQRFGHLTVVENRIGKGLKCLCDCGNAHRIWGTYHLRVGKITTCGRCHLAKKRLWTLDEIAIVKTYAGKLTAKQIVEKLGYKRTVASVKQKAQSLGLSLRQYGENCVWAKYSDHDCELARSLHEDGMPIKLICEKLEIPYHAMHSILYFKRG